jgi:hypothetical protein
LSRIFQIEWPDFKTAVRVELAENENPGLCHEFWNNLPFRTIFAASMSAGEMLKVPLPKMLKTPIEGPLHLFPDEPVGSLLYLGTLGMLLRWGKVVEPFRLARLGLTVKDDLPKLAEVAVKLTDAYFFTKAINFATFKKGT